MQPQCALGHAQHAGSACHTCRSGVHCSALVLLQPLHGSGGDFCGAAAWTGERVEQTPAAKARCRRSAAGREEVEQCKDHDQWCSIFKIFSQIWAAACCSGRHVAGCVNASFAARPNCPKQQQRRTCGSTSPVYSLKQRQVKPELLADKKGRLVHDGTHASLLQGHGDQCGMGGAANTNCVANSLCWWLRIVVLSACAQ